MADGKATMRDPGGEVAERREKARTEVWRTLALLWLAGVVLRLPLLAVPPVLPAIHRDLRLSETLVGLLTGLPIVLLAATTVLGSLLVARVGARRALMLGLLVVAVGGGARGLGGTAGTLLAMTVLMGLGIAISQPALPALAQQWWPGRTGLATAVYSNGLLIGEIAGAALTAPWLLSLVGGRWALALLVWSAPIALTALAIAAATSRHAEDRRGTATRWWPDWRSARTWRLGLILGCASITYFGSNTFIPEYLRATGHADQIAPALTSLNLAQLPGSFLVGAFPAPLIGRRGPILIAGALIVVSALGILLAVGGAWVLACAGVLGFASGLVFILSLALPPLLSGAADVHRLSAAMLTIAYLCGFLGPLCGGAAWDLTRTPATAFGVIVMAGALMLALAPGMVRPHHASRQ